MKSSHAISTDLSLQPLRCVEQSLCSDLSGTGLSLVDQRQGEFPFVESRDLLRPLRDHPSMSTKKYLSLEEAAQQLGMRNDELNKMREQGQIRGFADRGTWKFKVEDVEAFASSAFWTVG